MIYSKEQYAFKIFGADHERLASMPITKPLIGKVYTVGSIINYDNTCTTIDGVRGLFLKM